MEQAEHRLVNVEIFSSKDKLELMRNINEFLEDTKDSVEFINSSITYNTDTEEYVSLVSFYILDEMKFIEDEFKDD